MKRKKKKILWTSLGTISAIVLVPAVAVSCSSNSNNSGSGNSGNTENNKEQNTENEFKKFFQKIENNPPVANKTGEDIVPTDKTINSSNIESYLQNFNPPTLPKGSKLNFSNIIPDAKEGQVVFTLQFSETNNQPPIKSNSITVTGFLKEETAITHYKKKLNESINVNSIAINEEGKKVIPNKESITSDNIDQYLTGLPKTDNGVGISYDIVSTDPLTGIVVFNIITTSNKQVLKTITVKDFETIQQFINYVESLHYVNDGWNANPSGIPVNPNGENFLSEGWNPERKERTAQTAIAQTAAGVTVPLVGFLGKGPLGVDFKIIPFVLDNNNGTMTFIISADGIKSKILTVTGFLIQKKVPSRILNDKEYKIIKKENGL